MARLIALEWDDTECRLVVASRRNAGLLVEHAWVIPLLPEGEIPRAEIHPSEQSAAPAEIVTDSRGMAIVKLPTAVEIGAAIAEALKSRGIARGECLVAVGRTNVELKHLQLPPAPDDELPDMVRFQALRDFNKLQDDSPLDFIPLAADDGESRYVLAAAMSSDLVGEIHETCRTAGLQAKRFVLRPCAAASLLRRARPEETEQVSLLVDLLADETDLTVQVDGVEVFMRTARVTGDSAVPGGWRSLLVEIRRTMAAVSNQLGGRRVEAIYLCGDGQRHLALAKQIETELQLPAHLLDPFSAVELAPALAAALPEFHGRYAPLLGMLADEAAGTSPSIDFLHPRQRPEAPSRRRIWTLAAAVAAVLLLSCLYLGWRQFQDRYAAIGRLELEAKNIDKLMNGNKEVAKNDAKNTVEKKAKDVDAWVSGDRVWIDELRQISDKFVSAKDAMLISMSDNVALATSDITMDGLARNSSVINELVNNLRDSGHKVEIANSGEDTRQQQKNYPWKFSLRIGVLKAKAMPTTLAAASAKSAAANTEADRTSKSPTPEKNTPANLSPAKSASAKDAPAKSTAADAKLPVDAKHLPKPDDKSPAPVKTQPAGSADKGA